jgi:hypothetical protein
VFFNTGADALSDPRILYDAVSGRWFASIFDLTADSVVVAVSATSDPTGGWSLYTYALAGCPDQPRLGVDDNQVLVSVNLFSARRGGSCLGTRVVVFSKSEMLSAAPVANQLFGASGLFAIAAAQSLESSPVGWMASVDPNVSTALHVYEVSGTPPGATVSQSKLPVSPAIQTPMGCSRPGLPSIPEITASRTPCGRPACCI